MSSGSWDLVPYYHLLAHLSTALVVDKDGEERGLHDLTLVSSRDAQA